MIDRALAWARTKQSYRLMVRAHVAIATIAVLLGVVAAATERHVNLNAFLWLPVAIGLYRSKPWAVDLTKALCWLGIIAGPIMLLIVLAWPESDINMLGFKTGSAAIVAALLLPTTLFYAWTALAINEDTKGQAIDSPYAEENARI